jgi:hypothetical protein
MMAAAELKLDCDDDNDEIVMDGMIGFLPRRFSEICTILNREQYVVTFRAISARHGQVFKRWIVKNYKLTFSN